VGSATASLAEEVNALNEMGARGEIEWSALKALLVKVGDTRLPFAAFFSFFLSPFLCRFHGMYVYNARFSNYRK
jgi:hypothetical protein